MIHQTTKAEIWNRAAAVGSLWAALEIIVGSFLHNLQFPFTGTILASAAVALIVAVSPPNKFPGVTWRAALICAAMKSISPSSVLIGPMIGITAEGFLLEAFTLLLGRSRTGVLAGGIAAVSFTMVQKIIGMLFTYGSSIAFLFTHGLELTGKAIGIPGLSPINVLIALFLLTIGSGTASVFIGWGSTRKVPSEIFQGSNPENFYRAPVRSESIPLTTPSLSLLWIHAGVIVSTLLLFPLLPVVWRLGLTVAYVVPVVTHYGNAMRRIRSLKLWAEIIVLSSLSGLVFAAVSPRVTSTVLTGFNAALQMTLRAGMMVFSFSAFSIELLNPKILNFFRRFGLQTFELSLLSAFDILPKTIGIITSAGKQSGNPINLLASLRTELDRLVTASSSPNQSMLILLRGEKNQGKTRFLQNLTTLCKNKNIRVGGILSLCTDSSDGKSGYDVFDIAEEQSVRLCRKNIPEESDSIGPYHFLAEGLRFGNAVLERELSAQPDLFIIDEIGPLELQGKGWAAQAKKIFEAKSGVVIASVRPAIVQSLLEQWKFSADTIINVGTSTPEEFLREISPNRFSSGAGSPFDQA